MSNTEYTMPSIQQNVEKAFAPVVDAFKTVQSKLEVPEAARDFVKRSAETAKDRAADMHAGSLKATDAIETAASKTVSGLASFSRDVQAAAYDDATAYFSSLGKIAGAKSFGEAVQLHVDYLRERGEVNMGRAKSMFETVSGSLADGAKKAQETISKATNFSKAA